VWFYCLVSKQGRCSTSGPSARRSCPIKPATAQWLLRLMIQQSNCFQIVERGVAMQNLMQERALAGHQEIA